MLQEITSDLISRCAVQPTECKRDNQEFCTWAKTFWTIWFNNTEEKIKFPPRFWVGVNRHSFDFCRLFLFRVAVRLCLKDFFFFGELCFCHRYFLIESVALFKGNGGKKRQGEGECFHCAGQGKKTNQTANFFSSKSPSIHMRDK